MIQSNSVAKKTVYFRVFTDDQVAEVKRTAFDVMLKVGFRVLHQGARKMLKQAGALVNGEIVKIPEHLVFECIRTTPKGWTIYDREGRRALEVEGRKSYYGTSTASPKTRDAVTGDIHPTCVKDISRGAKVADALENVDWVMPMGSVQDVPPTVAELYEFEAVVTNTTKPIVFLGYTPRGVELVYEMAAEVAGGMDNLRQRPFLVFYPEPISPLVFPADVIDRLFVCADLFMPQIQGPTIQPGATGPVTLAGTIAQSVAESLMCLVLAQLRKPGCPIGLGTNIGIFDMAVSLLSVAAPEMSLALAAQAEVAQSLELPTWGLAGATDSKLIDAQAGSESAFSILAQGLSGINLIHDVGYLNGGMLCSAEQLVLGNENIGMTKRFIRGIEVNQETLARSIIEKVGPGGHFLTENHTYDHFKSQLWVPGLMERRGYDDWHADGAKSMARRIHDKIEDILKNHHPRSLPDDIRNAVSAIKRAGEKEILGE